MRSKNSIEYMIETKTGRFDTAQTPIGAKRKANEIMRDERKPVYVSWYRKSDGCTGGLDQNGNHTVSSRAWNPASVPLKPSSRGTPKKTVRTKRK
ncbi:MAG: hypothetical protein WCR24_07510 [Candidatus Methanomethylophilaceae archaeon]